MVLFLYMQPRRIGWYPSPPVQTSKKSTSIWLSVSEAALRCSELGLSRTPKTIRKWASSSYISPENGDISVRREDTENGFRWSIEVSSLDRKIEQELEFERRKQAFPDRTGAHHDAQVLAGIAREHITEPDPNRSEPVQTRAEETESTRIEAELRSQLEQTRAEVEFLREELKHRRQTDKALGTVIEAFRLNAEATRAQLMKETAQERSAGKNGQRHDIVPNEHDAQIDSV